ncbi:protein GRAVITROPIC IN THE LIGHT 1 isoform X2 [Cajanus cajan]|uniref:protein GRAVITROPIC IN THE LIGHT 1 isoform X2 n=1 Tax=Cajanus cajan TaxID=3821 RepID=UPI00098D7DB4|nr:protein GRAVITROPIC IN THE LIGHT 1 isoform X2 [Cajanus cajan]XP_020203200.1 protein GRAVITROPIC IN THE LIGHT 1 isoform X2 [Cajanus cajan]XP_029130581.1 protein GRAVITROPIC IN THE LIGHT 1 isoform X2 [Cajanus cajan]
MECSETKPVKPNSSNISEMVCKFAKVCKLKSIGVFSSEIPNLPHLHRPICNEAPLSENSSEENRCCDQKVHPHPIEVPAKEDACAVLEVTRKIFDAVSALKLSYLQLQQAHIPYDPQKIVAADDLVVAELEKLCKFKREYTQKQCKKTRFRAARSDPLMAEIVAKEALLGKLKSQNSAKDSEISRLWRELLDLEIGNKNLTEKIKQISLEKRRAHVLSDTKFQDVFKAASKSIHDFAKPLISLMKASGWDLDKAANSIENGAVYSKRCDKKYAFEAYIARRMFHGITLTSCNVSDIMKFDDPFDALMENPHSDFAKFCQAKYLLVVHPKMEESFFGNLDHRTFIVSGKHPRTEFYQLFAKMAKCVWVLLGSAVAIDPEATLFSVSRGSMFSSLYMESVEEEKESAVLSDEERETCKVQFMIMPGFQIGKMVVKSRVYISKHSSS